MTACLYVCMGNDMLSSTAQHDLQSDLGVWQMSGAHHDVIHNQLDDGAWIWLGLPAETELPGRLWI